MRLDLTIYFSDLIRQNRHKNSAEEAICPIFLELKNEIENVRLLAPLLQIGLNLNVIASLMS